MKRDKLNITFHNPNTDEETIKYISTIFAEAMVRKVEQQIKTEEQIEDIEQEILEMHM